MMITIFATHSDDQIMNPTTTTNDGQSPMSVFEYDDSNGEVTSPSESHSNQRKRAN